LDDGSSAPAKKAWTNAVAKASGRSHVLAPETCNLLEELGTKDLTTMISFLEEVAANKPNATVKSGLVRSLAFVIDEYRTLCLGLPRVTTTAKGAYLDNVLNLFAGGQNPASAQLDIQSEHLPGPVVPLPLLASTAALRAPEGPPTRGNFRMRLESIRQPDFQILFEDYCWNAGKFPLLLGSATDRDAAWPTFVRRACMQNESAWAKLAEDIRSGNSTLYAKKLAMMKAEDVSRLAEFRIFREYVAGYADWWNIKPTLESLFPASGMPDNFWTGPFNWCVWAGLEQLAKEIAAGDDGNSNDRLAAVFKQAAVDSGWKPNGPDPIVYWLVSDGRRRVEVVSANMKVPSRLASRPPQQRTPIISMWREIVKIGVLHGFPTIVGDILGPVSGLLCVGSGSRPDSIGHALHR
jgi:hypothetical protein